MNLQNLAASALALLLVAFLTISCSDSSGSGPAPVPVDTELLAAIQDLASDDIKARSRGATTLRRAGTEAAPLLRDVIRNLGNPVLRRALAVRLLGELRPAATEDIELIGDQLNRGPSKVAATATEALAAIGEPAVATLLKALHVGSYRDRYKIAQLLATIGGPAIPGLIEAAGSEDAVTERAVLSALAGADGLEDHAETALPRFLEALDSPDERVGRLAGRGLARLGQPALDALLDRVLSGEGELKPTIAALSQMGADESVAGLAGSGDPTKRIAAIEIIGGWSDLDSDMVRLIADALSDTDPGVRKAAMLQLRNRANLQLKPAIPALLKVLSDPDEDMRRLAEDTLVGIGPAIAHRIRFALKSTDDIARIHAIRAIGRLNEGGFGARPYLEEALESENEEVREAARRSLENLQRRQDRMKGDTPKAPR